jgi:hypothetical protein
MRSMIQVETMGQATTSNKWGPQLDDFDGIFLETRTWLSKCAPSHYTFYCNIDSEWAELRTMDSMEYTTCGQSHHGMQEAV